TEIEAHKKRSAELLAASNTSVRPMRAQGPVAATSPHTVHACTPDCPSKAHLARWGRGKRTHPSQGQDARTALAWGRGVPLLSTRPAATLRWCAADPALRSSPP